MAGEIYRWFTSASTLAPSAAPRRAHDQDDEDEFCELHWSSICSISRTAGAVKCSYGMLGRVFK
jgi:hypothetical protein